MTRGYYYIPDMLLFYEILDLDGSAEASFAIFAIALSDTYDSTYMFSLQSSYILSNSINAIVHRNSLFITQSFWSTRIVFGPLKQQSKIATRNLLVTQWGYRRQKRMTGFHFRAGKEVQSRWIIHWLLITYCFLHFPRIASLSVFQLLTCMCCMCTKLLIPLSHALYLLFL